MQKINLIELHFWKLYLQTDDGEIRYIVEVDLIYLLKMKERTLYIPFCPESKIKDVPLSTNYMEKKTQGIYKPVKNLVFDQIDKIGYLCPNCNVKFCLRNGIEVLKLKWVNRFEQKPWMENDIDKNTELLCINRLRVWKTFPQKHESHVIWKTNGRCRKKNL